MNYTHCHPSCELCNGEREIKYVECACGEMFVPEDGEKECPVCTAYQRVVDATDDCAVLDSVDRATDIREAMRR